MTLQRILFHLNKSTETTEELELAIDLIWFLLTTNKGEQKMLNEKIVEFIKDTIMEYKHNADFGDSELVTLIANKFYWGDEKTAGEAYTLFQEGSYESAN
jgi:hypothetical protein